MSLRRAAHLKSCRTRPTVSLMADRYRCRFFGFFPVLWVSKPLASVPTSPGRRGVPGSQNRRRGAPKNLRGLGWPAVRRSTGSCVPCHSGTGFARSNPARASRCRRPCVRSRTRRKQVPQADGTGLQPPGKLPPPSQATPSAQRPRWSSRPPLGGRQPVGQGGGPNAGREPGIPPGELKSPWAALRAASLCRWRSTQRSAGPAGPGLQDCPRARSNTPGPESEFGPTPCGGRRGGSCRSSVGDPCLHIVEVEIGETGIPRFPFPVFVASTKALPTVGR